MIKRFSVALILTISLVFAVPGCKKTQDDTQSKFFKHNARAVSLFNGNNFEGWLADTNYFRIDDTEIVAGTLDAPIDTMIWMTTKERYDNFILDLDVKLMGGNKDETANAGIWFRCHFNEENLLIGYETDMWINREEADSIWWGSLHDPFRRDLDEFNIIGNQDSLKRVLNKNDWNHFKIYCNGPHILVWVNDFLTADYTERDPSIAQTGIIGLQLHDGPPSKVWYKNIIITEL